MGKGRIRMRLKRFQTVIRPYRHWLYGLIIPLLFIGAIGFGYWKLNPPKVIAAPAFTETHYYSQLVYAVNEMKNQVEKFDSLRRFGSLSDAELQQGRTQVNILMSPLTVPPEELSVAQAIAEDLFATYLQYVDQLAAGDQADPDLLQESFAQSQRHVELFRQNARLMTLLNAYKGVDVYCH